MMNRRCFFSAPLAAIGLGGVAATERCTVNLDTTELCEEIAQLRLALQRAELSESLARRLETPRGKLRNINFGDIHVNLNSEMSDPEKLSREIRQAFVKAFEDEWPPSA
jgi:hypothetical protein